MLIAMVAIMIAAVGIDRAVQYSGTRKWAKERRERYEVARAEAAQIQMTISELSQDQRAIEEFIRENQQYFDEMEEQADLPAAQEADSVSEGESFLETVSGNSDIEGSVSENALSGNEISDNDISESTISGNAVSGNAISDNDISGNDVLDNDISGNDVSGMTLLEKRKIRGSYEETIFQSRLDQEIIMGGQIDFSDKKIVCLGDSITAATNLEQMEDYQQYAYPACLKEILGAKEVVNLGIGGSSIGRYWENAFVDRYRDIPEDADMILVMGGTNDGFCVTQEDFGIMEERKEGTFIGDLDELMKGLKENYPDAQIILITPLPNVLHDMLRKERDYLLPQSMIANAMKQIGKEYEVPVIDLYNSNILDSHDAAVIFNYMPDGVHCNPEGYELLARHIAAEVISLYEMQEGNFEEEL